MLQILLRRVQVNGYDTASMLIVRDDFEWVQVELWTRRRHLSPVLTRRIRAYYAEVWLHFAGERS